MFDTIIIGSGPSGISAAIYLKRFGFNVLVIGKDYGTLAINTPIENYYGIDKIYGVELIEKGINQAVNLGVEVLKEEVLQIELGDGFVVSTTSGDYTCKSVYLATGMKRNTLNVPGLKEFEGKGISYCAVCDGFLYRKKRLAIIGSGDYMKSELEVLKRFSKDIIVFTNGKSVELDETVVNEKIISFTGNEKLETVVTTNDSYNVDCVFIAEGAASGFSFAKHLGILLDDKNHIIVNDYQTNIPGVFAGGDVIGGVKQIVKAASDGCCAAYKIKEYLKGN